MNKTWNYIEKTIAIFLILWGLARLILSVLMVVNFKNFLDSHTHLLPEVSFIDVIFSHHTILMISIFTLLAGILLIFSKKAGLILSISACLIHAGIAAKSFLPTQQTALKPRNKSI